MLVSTRDPDRHELRSFRIVDGVVTEEPVTVVDTYESVEFQKEREHDRQRFDPDNFANPHGRREARQRHRRHVAGGDLRPGVQLLGHLGTARRRHGKLHRFVNIYVNDEDVRFSGGLDTEINDGDTVTILPAVAGGGRA